MEYIEKKRKGKTEKGKTEKLGHLSQSNSCDNLERILYESLRTSYETKINSPCQIMAHKCNTGRDDSELRKIKDDIVKLMPQLDHSKPRSRCMNDLMKLLKKKYDIVKLKKLIPDRFTSRLLSRHRRQNISNIFKDDACPLSITEEYLFKCIDQEDRQFIKIKAFNRPCAEAKCHKENIETHPYIFFYSEDVSELLNCQRIVIDGTWPFGYNQPHFAQVVLFCCDLNNGDKKRCLFGAILPHKNLESYNVMWSFITSLLGGMPRCDLVCTDHETSLHKTADFNILSTSCKFCRFHSQQILLLDVATGGMKKEYNDMKSAFKKNENLVDKDLIYFAENYLLINMSFIMPSSLVIRLLRHQIDMNAFHKGPLKCKIDKLLQKWLRSYEAKGNHMSWNDLLINSENKEMIDSTSNANEQTNNLLARELKFDRILLNKIRPIVRALLYLCTP